ncbi:13869_t:CDS:2 [Rhizophagus irregularis]|nr:13869_t:CDS:2 [Rhizophagus irregularis]
MQNSSTIYSTIPNTSMITFKKTDKFIYSSPITVTIQSLLELLQL